VDNQDEPVIAMKNTDLVGNNGLVPYPFSFCAPAKTENSTWCGYNLILPIPYNKGCKVTFEATVPTEAQVDWEGHYYQINYRSYAKNTRVKSFDKHTLDIYQRKSRYCTLESTIKQLIGWLINPCIFMQLGTKVII